MPTEPCYCNSPLCDKSEVCKLLGEYRIAYKILSNLIKDSKLLKLETIQEAIDFIEIECEILAK